MLRDADHQTLTQEYFALLRQCRNRRELRALSRKIARRLADGAVELEFAYNKLIGYDDEGLEDAVVTTLVERHKAAWAAALNRYLAEHTEVAAPGWRRLVGLLTGRYDGLERLWDWLTACYRVATPVWTVWLFVCLGIVYLARSQGIELDDVVAGVLLAMGLPVQGLVGYWRMPHRLTRPTRGSRSVRKQKKLEQQHQQNRNQPPRP